MQVRKINESTIQVSMDVDELKQRGVTMLDLLGNKNQIQKFFYQILQEVDVDHTFAKNEPVTFQVMPSNTGLELLISKSVEGEDNQVPDQLQQLLAGLDKKASKDDRNTEIVNDSDSNANVELAENTRRVFKLKNIDYVVGLADSLFVDGLASSLYIYHHEYYLDLAFIDEYAEMKPNDVWAIANEFGLGMSMKKFNKIKPKAKPIIFQDALGNLRHYFSNSK